MLSSVRPRDRRAGFRESLHVMEANTSQPAGTSTVPGNLDTVVSVRAGVVDARFPKRLPDRTHILLAAHLPRAQVAFARPSHLHRGAGRATLGPGPPVSACHPLSDHRRIPDRRKRQPPRRHPGGREEHRRAVGSPHGGRPFFHVSIEISRGRQSIRLVVSIVGCRKDHDFRFP